MILMPYDVPVLIGLGVFFGWLFAKKLYHENQFYIATLFGVTCLFWLNVLLSNLGVMAPWHMTGVAVDLNSTAIGVFYVLSYPLWFIWGSRLFGYIWGKTPHQNGLMWLVGHTERAKPFKPTWKSDET